MAKYSPNFKKMVVQDYLRGYTTLAKKYKAKTRNQVESWVKLYRDFGSEGLKNQHSKINYSVQTKVDAVELCLRTELPYREITKKIWHSKYFIDFELEESLFERRYCGALQTERTVINYA